MGLFKQFATNRKLEIEGVPVKFSPNPDGTVPTVFVKRTLQASQKYQAIFTRVTKPYKHEIEKGTISDEDDEMLMQSVCAEAMVTGWENVRMPVGVAGGAGEGDAVEETYSAAEIENIRLANKGYDIPFTKQAVCEVFHVLPDMWRAIAATSADPDAYRVGELEEMAKNL